MNGTPPVYTPDGKVTALLADYEVEQETRQACIRVCVENGAVDVLPMLGVTE